MGLVLLGLSTLNRNGLMGAGLQMFSHGVLTALFFAVTGMIYDRSHTRQIPELGGMNKVMPFAAIGFIVSGLASMGMPGFPASSPSSRSSSVFGNPTGWWPFSQALPLLLRRVIYA